jgi:outer membrane protein TolC
LERFVRIGRATACILAVALYLGPRPAWGQVSDYASSQPRRESGPAALPERTPPITDSGGVVAPPRTPPSILSRELQPIDLQSALRLANVQNPELNIARRRILEAAALRQLTAAYFLPSINPGLNYDSHTGTLQQSNGNILSLNRSALFVGAGANAVAAGTVNIPGVYYAGNIGLGVYNYLASRQVVAQREFESLAVRNQMLLQVATSYSELLRSEGRRAASIQARDEAREIARVTAAFAATGEGRAADANRAATVLANWESRIQASEAEIFTASARLCQLLNLDPSIRLHPTDAVVVPQPIVPDPIPVSELIALGLLRRPELAAQRAAIEAAFLTLGGAKILPFSPNFLLGFSAGGFGGGSNLVRPIFGGFSGREDLDVVTYWTIQNLGLGNIALINVASARLQISRLEQVELLNLVRADVAEAYARTHARYAQIATYEEAVRAGYLSFHEDLDRIRLMGVLRPRDVLPIELLNGFSLLSVARIDYIDAIVDYNESQFAMYVALGQPPADALAHPVPTEGLAPRNLPPGSAPPGTLSPLPIPATPDANARPPRVVVAEPASPASGPSAGSSGLGVPTAGARAAIPPPVRLTDRVQPSGN